MAEYIEREAAIRVVNGQSSFTMTRSSLIDSISNIPAADVAPVVHARWETNSDRPDSLICPVCKYGFDMWKHDPHNYCPNCGTKMDGGSSNAKSM